MDFLYQGKTRANKDVKGTISARDELEARMLLREQQIRPIKLSPKGKMNLSMDLGDITANVKIFEPGIKLKDLVLFTRQFSVMIDSGIPQMMALDILSKQTENPTLRKVILDIRTRVEQGNSLTTALSKHPKVFNHLYQNLVAAGEAGGVLDIIMRRLADYLEKSQALANKVRGAMFYPGAVLFISIFVVWGLLTFVVPKFVDLIKTSGGEVPAITMFMMNLSNFFQEHWYVIFIMIGGPIVLFKVIMETPASRRVFDQYILRAPLVGMLVKKICVSRFTRTMSILIQSGVPILDSLEIVSNVTGNVMYKDSLMKAKESISEGRPMVTPLEQDQIFPPMVTQMVGVGEKTGALDQMLSKIADFYDNDVDATIGAMTSLIEPLMMVFLGLVVGSILIALYLPIFKMAGAVSGAG